jgi:hypothetical protein
MPHQWVLLARVLNLIKVDQLLEHNQLKFFEIIIWIIMPKFFPIQNCFEKLAKDLFKNS